MYGWKKIVANKSQIFSVPRIHTEQAEMLHINIYKVAANHTNHVQT